MLFWVVKNLAQERLVCCATTSFFLRKNKVAVAQQIIFLAQE
jgi:hypothetical protein